MKAIYSLKIFSLTTAFLLLLIPAISAQARYKHIPRVKIDKERNIESKTKVEKSSITKWTPADEKTVLIAEEAPVSNLTAVPNNIVLPVQKIKKSFGQSEQIEQHEKIDKGLFSSKLKEHRKLPIVNKIPEATKIVSIIWFILSFAVAAILIVLAIILLVVLAYSFYYLFFIFGFVILLIAFILLVLYLV